MPRLLMIFAAAWLLVSGCTTTPVVVPESVDRADRLQQQGDSVAAAQMYERLALGNPPPVRNDLAMAAARAWLAANRADDAQRALGLAVGETRAAQQLELGMLGVEVAAARGQLELAWQQVSGLAQPRDPVSASRLLQLRQQIALRVGRPVEAVRAGQARELAVATEDERMAARRDLLAGLRSGIEAGLRLDPGASNEPLVRGWLEIAQIAAAASRNPLSAESDVARWRSRFPGHPAATIVEREILRPGERMTEGRTGTMANAGPMALLLPLTPREPRGAHERGVAAAAGLIRAGFQEALSRLPEADRPQLRIYDTGALGVGTALLNARGDGAGFVVGPLEKEEVQAAQERRPAGVPILLLNTPPGGGYLGNHVYQFALAPEDEARQIARQVAAAGRGNAVLIAPAGEWGSRVASAFAQELTQAGGSIVAQGNYDSSDYTATLRDTVTALLGIDAAVARKDRVKSTIGADVTFDAYPRPDIDAIFAPGVDSTAVRYLASLLFSYYASDIPTYITPDGVSSDQGENRDLVGMRLLDMPWVLDSIGPVADLKVATEPEWEAEGADMSRYFAFGYDAATLAIALRRGATAWPLAGLTGRLQLTPEGRVERSLNWARLARDGSIQPFDPN
jgi:outer membrane PBP1 activator LpoA protein